MGLLAPFSVPRGGILYTMIVSGEGFAPFKVVSRVCLGGMGLDEIDTCIRRWTTEHRVVSSNPPGDVSQISFSNCFISVLC